MPQEIWIIGCGPGGADYVLPAARTAAARADVLAGAARLFELFPDFPGRKLPLGAGGTPTFLDALARETDVVAVLVSGDPGLCSLCAPVVERFGAENCRVVPGISSVQVAFARLGLDWSGARILSTHAGAALPPAQTLLDAERIAILAGNPQTDAELCRLAGELANTHRAVICRDLTLPEESVCVCPAPPTPADLGRGRILVLLLRQTEHPR